MLLPTQTCIFLLIHAFSYRKMHFPAKRYIQMLYTSHLSLPVHLGRHLGDMLMSLGSREKKKGKHHRMTIWWHRDYIVHTSMKEDSEDKVHRQRRMTDFFRCLLSYILTSFSHFPAPPKYALSRKNLNGFRGGYMAGNRRRLQEGFRAQESRTLANFHKIHSRPLHRAPCHLTQGILGGYFWETNRRR